MQIAFQADNDLNKAIARAMARREPAVDFQTAHTAHLVHAPAPQVLAAAAAGGRILISHDFQILPEHFQNFVRQHPSPGVLLVPQDLPVGTVVETLLQIWAATESTEWENRLCLIPNLVTIAAADPAPKANP